MASFNIKHGSDHHHRVDLDLVARTCAAFNADVLALQEVDLRRARSRFVNQTARIAQITGLTGIFGTASTAGIGRMGNAVLVRGSIEDHAVFALPQRSREPRSCLFAKAQIGGRPLSIAVMHLSTRRQEALDQLRIALERLKTLPAPRLLLGDLNLELEQVVQPIADAGMQLIGHAPTFPHDVPRLTIDHVAVAGLHVVGIDVPLTQCSDHRPVIADVEFVDAPAVPGATPGAAPAPSEP